MHNTLTYHNNHSMIERGFRKAHDEQYHEPFKLDLPEIKPLNLKTGLLITGGLIIVGITAGAFIGSQLFFGTVSIVGLVLLAENNKYVKWVIVNGNIWIDLLIFGASLYALIKLGPTVAGGLTFAGVAYSGVVAPYYRQKYSRERGFRKQAVC